MQTGKQTDREDAGKEKRRGEGERERGGERESREKRKNRENEGKTGRVEGRRIKERTRQLTPGGILR